MHQKIRVKLEIIMILTILIIGCTTSSTTERSSSTTHRAVTTRRLRHHRSNRSSTNSTTQHLEDEFARNARLVSSNEWKCGVPKPRLVYLNEAIQSEPVVMYPHIQWIVNAAVLYRCEDALGCCLHPKRCSPSRSEQVTITFKALNTHTAEITYPQHQFSNHTRCACVTPTT